MLQSCDDDVGINLAGEGTVLAPHARSAPRAFAGVYLNVRQIHGLCEEPIWLWIPFPYGVPASTI